MKRSLAAAHCPLVRSLPPRLDITPTRRLATSAATSTETTVLSTSWGRTYLTIGCATTVAWGALVFANEWDEGGRRGDSTDARLCSASSVLATKSLVVVGLGAIWPLAPVLLVAWDQHLSVEERHREAERRIEDDRRRERQLRHERMERERRQKERERQEQREREQRARDCEARQRAVAMSTVLIPAETKEGGMAGTATEPQQAPLCRWCLQAH
ncbi:hypothetical protein pdul_cds_666 [Pandoravirus dulcis]|uniref:Uncharacterized protein n=1 Tax=Pandoravirus dulcis TaxID=1349409 RepID=S4VR21_9VIRU|nr:hypothetical protein pdul_cds_666 [Pandoravirus dulcis]AGO82813.1 hypothetical protein pdul_cds_666 [Pandoravirus dulcis]